MRTIAIIPARMAASRFPNKPMAKIMGIPMIGHVYKRTTFESIFDEVYVATCDQEIFDYIHSIGGKAVMTANTHERCTDRTAEALLKIEKITGAKFDIIGMVQGDEPLVVPQVFKEALMNLKENPEEFESPNTVKVVIDLNNNALYFSREPIPSRKKFSDKFPKYKQTGMIFFRRDFLIEFNQMTPTMLEKIESVDMMRILEHGKKIRMVMTSNACYGVDIPEDIQKINNILIDDPYYLEYRKSFEK
jgi:3-deoxy-manno-octulosonate cytidylyltransferase (CMP-KDO synthetase)